jgi:hypothetical protein
MVLQAFLLLRLRSVVFFISECWYSQNVPLNRQIKLFEINTNVDNIGAFREKISSNSPIPFFFLIKETLIIPS